MNYEREIEILKQTESKVIGMQLYAPNREIAIGTQEESTSLLTANQGKSGFYELQFSALELAPGQTYESLVGRVLLAANTEVDALSPMVISPGKQGYKFSMLNQPYDPSIGFTAGQHFGLSAEAQTRSSSFGEHSTSGLEAGHFSSILLATRDERIRRGIVSSGDIGTHQAIDTGLSTQMSQVDLLPASYKVVSVQASDTRPIKAFWHAGLELVDGPARGNFDNTLAILMGGAVARLGAKGVSSAMQLVDRALAK